LEIANVSNTPVLLYPGRLIAQLVLMRIAPPDPRFEQNSQETHLVARSNEANYFGPVYPEAPKFKDPQDDLREIGITTVSSLKRTRLTAKGESWLETIYPLP
jgi:hypothetical protein